MRMGMVFLGAMVLIWGVEVFGADMHHAMAGGASQQPESSFTGTVLDTTNASRYTYVQIKTGEDTMWVAGPVFQVKAGDRVTVQGAMPVRNFKSKVINRTFELLYMAGSIAPAGNPVAPTAIPPIQRPDGGKTVAEIWSEKDSLAGKTVIIRAKVVKVTPKILKSNWLHLRDGTGSEGGNDLVVTTKADVSVGDVITVSGTISANKDFGSGYRYDVILEDATVLAK